MSATHNMKQKAPNRQTTLQLKIIFQNVNGRIISACIINNYCKYFIQNAHLVKLSLKASAITKPKCGVGTLQKFKILFWRSQLESTKWQVTIIYETFWEEVHISIVMFTLSIPLRSVFNFFFSML
jgi:hypothetical protein